MSGTRSQNRPNVVVILADDMGYGDLGWINGGTSYTPHLDRLASGAVNLSQAYSASCVCAPARAALMTGRYPHRTGCTSLNDFHGLNRLNPAERTLADRFKESGYATGLVGKWHMGETADSHPNRRGFDEFVGFLGGAGDYWDWSLERNGTHIKPDGRYLTEVITEEAIDFLERHDRDPFFLYVGYYTPHRPLQAPEDVLDRYLSREDLSPGQARVYAMLEVMDRGIGRILDTLESKGIRENTMVLFASDNGPDPIHWEGVSPLRPNLGLHGTKYEVFEGGIRVPCMISWPEARLNGGADNDTLLHFIDVAPTLVEACGLRTAPGDRFDGASRWPEFTGAPAGTDPVRFWQWNRYLPQFDCNAAVRDGVWKLVYPGVPPYFELSPGDVEMAKAIREGALSRETITPIPEQELIGESPRLFNLSEDPGETEDMSARYPERVSKMQAALTRWFEDVMSDFRENLDGRLHG